MERPLPDAHGSDIAAAPRRPGRAGAGRVGSVARGLTGPRYLLAVLILAVLSTVPMVVAIGAGRAALEPVVPSTTSVRPFLPPSDGQSPPPVPPQQPASEPSRPVEESGAADEVGRDAADKIAASCAAKSGDLAIVCRFRR